MSVKIISFYFLITFLAAGVIWFSGCDILDRTFKDDINNTNMSSSITSASSSGSSIKAEGSERESAAHSAAFAGRGAHTSIVYNNKKSAVFNNLMRIYADCIDHKVINSF